MIGPNQRWVSILSHCSLRDIFRIDVLALDCTDFTISSIQRYLSVASRVCGLNPKLDIEFRIEST